jgi:hypothetical protein
MRGVLKFTYALYVIYASNAVICALNAVYALCAFYEVSSSVYLQLVLNTGTSFLF